MTDVTQLQNFHHGGLLGLRATYDDRVERWRPPLRNVGSAFEQASENFKNTLVAAGKEATARRDFYFSVLSLALGLQLKWVGYWASGTLQGRGLSDNVKSYLSGSLESSVNFLANQGVTGIRNTIDCSLPSLTVGPLQFQNELLNKFDQKKNLVKTLFSDIAREVHSQDAWAEAALRSAGSLDAAKAMVRSWEADMERNWLGTCYYYRYSPEGMENVADMSRKLERGLWSMWVQTNIRAGIRVHRPNFGNDYQETREEVFTNPEEATLTRLEELRVIAPASVAERRGIRRSVEANGGTWRPDYTAPVPNFGWVDDYADVTQLITWSRDHDIEMIGNLPPRELPLTVRLLQPAGN